MYDRYGAYNENANENAQYVNESGTSEQRNSAATGLPPGHDLPTAPWRRFFLPAGPWSDYDEETGEPVDETWVDAPSAVTAADLAERLFGPEFRGTQFARIGWKDADTGEAHTFVPAGPEGVTPEWAAAVLAPASRAKRVGKANGEHGRS